MATSPGADRDYGAGARIPTRCIRTARRFRRIPMTTSSMTLSAMTTSCSKARRSWAEPSRRSPIPHLFNLDTLRWRRGPQHPTAILNSGGWTTWDESRRVLWGHSGDDGGGNAFIGFHPDGDNGNGNLRTLDRSLSEQAARDRQSQRHADRSVRDIIVVSVHARDELHAIDPADPAREIVRLKSVGSKPLLRPYAALEYAPNIARLVYFSPLDDGIVYTIAPSRDRGSDGRPVRGMDVAGTQPAAGTLQADRRRGESFALRRELASRLWTISNCLDRRSRCRHSGSACRQPGICVEPQLTRHMPRYRPRAGRRRSTVCAPS